MGSEVLALVVVIAMVFIIGLATGVVIATENDRDASSFFPSRPPKPPPPPPPPARVDRVIHELHFQICPSCKRKEPR